MFRTALTVILLVGTLGSTTALAQTASDDTPASTPIAQTASDDTPASTPDAPLTSEQEAKLESMMDDVAPLPSYDRKGSEFPSEAK